MKGYILLAAPLAFQAQGRDGPLSGSFVMVFSHIRKDVLFHGYLKRAGRGLGGVAPVGLEDVGIRYEQI